MNKYYNVAINDCLFEHDGLNLRDHLWFVSQDMYYRDCAFREFVFGELFDTNIESAAIEELFDEHNQDIQKMSDNNGIPYSFILVDDGNKLYELATKTEFRREKGEEMIEKYEITPEEVIDFYEENPYYDERANYFFKSYSRNKYTSPSIDTSEYRHEITEDVHLIK